MHIVLTDILTCPHCGPEFGLIMLADRIEDRHVLEGRLGCANCREAYPISGGVADLRWGDTADRRSAADDLEGAPVEDEEKPLRLAALLGLTGPSQPVAIVTRDAALVGQVQAYLPDTAVLGVSAEAPPEGGEAGMGWLLAGETLPLRSRALGGVVLADGASAALLEDSLRSLGRGSRLVVDPAPPETREVLLQAGAELLLEQNGVAVAFDPRAG